MTNCVVCKVGRLEQSGSHIYCDSCDLSYFAMTSDYMEMAAGLLGLLLSNTRFPLETSIDAVILSHMLDHTPALHNWLHTLDTGYDAALKGIVDVVKMNSINVQIGDEVTNEQKSNDLICSCGCKDFVTDVSKTSWNHIKCTQCHMQYYSDETTDGAWLPYFACVTCGHNDYTKSPDGILAVCFQCDELYTHDAVHGIFRKVNNDN